MSGSVEQYRMRADKKCMAVQIGFENADDIAEFIGGVHVTGSNDSAGYIKVPTVDGVKNCYYGSYLTKDIANNQLDVASQDDFDTKWEKDA